VNLQGRYQTKEIWKDAEGNDLHPHTNYAVGGNTKFYGAALFRLRKEDFGELRHHGGISPAWPITAALPCARRAQRGSHRAAGERPLPSPGGEPRAAASTARRDFAARGLRPFHTPLGIMLDEKRPHASRCIRCNTCDGYPCLGRGSPMRR